MRLCGFVGVFPKGTDTLAAGFSLIVSRAHTSVGVQFESILVPQCKPQSLFHFGFSFSTAVPLPVIQIEPHLNTEQKIPILSI